MDIITTLAKELQIKPEQAGAAVKLIDEGNTIPFIARYRKEVTGALNDEILRDLHERLEYLRNLEEKKQQVISSIEDQGKMTEELKNQIEAAKTLVVVDDLYRPYRPKRRTRAAIAKEKGLEPLANIITLQMTKKSLEEEARAFVDPEKGVDTVESAIAGASDIIAEAVSDEADYRIRIREMTVRNGMIASRARDPQAESVYEMYYEFSERIAKIVGHRILALNRGEAEKILTVRIEAPEEDIIRYLEKQIIIKKNPVTTPVLQAVIRDSYQRLIAPSIEREIRNSLTEKAEDGAIRVFGKNLEQLLMQPPIVNRVVLGWDPAFRTGCKIAVVDTTGKVLDTTVIYPTAPQNKTEESKAVIKKLIEKYHSMARRLQDPLAELVKIDPKSIGVGQYQHDMNQKKLNEALSGVVEDCVNKVGVDLNTASTSLLEYISGISKTVARNIVAYREANGRFESRAQLLKVAKLGPKAYEQCAGFTRITDGRNPLDATAVHPESYEATGRLLEKLGYTPQDITAGRMKGISGKIHDYKKMSEELDIGEITLRDIVKELEKPARDPREDMPKPILRSDVLEMKDLTAGMILKGTVRNVTDFGVFVDIGVHQDGLVHISQICDRFIRHPLEAVSVGDIADVMVMSVDLAKKRIQLTMKGIN